MRVSMGDVWDRATEFLGDNLGALLPVVLLGIFGPISVQGALAPLAETPGHAAIAIRLVSLLLSIVTLWAQLAIMALAIDPAQTREGAMRTGRARLLPSIGIALLLLAAVIAAMLPIPVVLAVSGYDLQAAMAGQQADLAPGAAIFVTLYGLALSLVLLWLFARIALVNPVIVGERRGIGAVARSFSLTRGITWKIVGVVILFAIVATVAVLATKTVFGSVLAIIAPGDGPVGIATVLSAIFVALVSTAFTVLAAAFTAKLYVAVEPASGATAPAQ